MQYIDILTLFFSFRRIFRMAHSSAYKSTVGNERKRFDLRKQIILKHYIMVEL